ncbi:hypothetical protein V6N13_037447 [Hibiscus sabdariffa]
MVEKTVCLTKCRTDLPPSLVHKFLHSNIHTQVQGDIADSNQVSSSSCTALVSVQSGHSNATSTPSDDFLWVGFITFKTSKTSLQHGINTALQAT